MTNERLWNVVSIQILFFHARNEWVVTIWYDLHVSENRGRPNSESKAKLTIRILAWRPRLVRRNWWMRSCCEQTMHSTIHGEDIVPCSHCPPPAYHHESRPAINDALFLSIYHRDSSWAVCLPSCWYLNMFDSGETSLDTISSILSIKSCHIAVLRQDSIRDHRQSRRYLARKIQKLNFFLLQWGHLVLHVLHVLHLDRKIQSICSRASPKNPCTLHENNSKTQQDMAKKTIVCLTACKNCSSRATHCFFNP